MRKSFEYLYSVKEALINDYYNMSNKDLSVKYGYSEEVIRKFLRFNKVERKVKPQINTNDGFFKVIDTEEKAYFLGLITADGSINKCRNKLSFTINPVDVYIIERLKSCIGSSAPINESTYVDKRNGTVINSCSVQIYSKRIVKDLCSLGICEDKSVKATFPKLPKDLLRHYVRGIVDGDGWISEINSNISICLSSSLFFDFKKELSLIGVEIRKYKERLTSNGSIIKLYIKGPDCSKFLEWLYKDSSIRLERKYNSYLKQVESRKFKAIATPRVKPVIDREEGLLFVSSGSVSKYLGMSNTYTVEKVMKNNPRYVMLNKCYLYLMLNGDVYLKTIDGDMCPIPGDYRKEGYNIKDLGLRVENNNLKIL